MSAVEGSPSENSAIVTNKSSCLTSFVRSWRMESTGLLCSASCQASLKHFQECHARPRRHGPRYDVGLVGHLAWCNHRVSREVRWKYADEAELLFTEKGSEQGTYEQQLQKVCAVVRGIPKLKGIVDDFLATMNGAIKCMPQYEGETEEA